MKIISNKEYNDLKAKESFRYKKLMIEKNDEINILYRQHCQQVGDVRTRSINAFQHKIGDLEDVISRLTKKVEEQRDLITKLYKDIDSLQKIKIH